MKVLDYIKRHKGGIIAASVAVVLLCALIVSIALLAKPQASQSKGYIDKADLSGGTLSYSKDTDAYFRECFKTYYNKFFAEFLKDMQVTQRASEILNPYEISSIILNTLKNGHVTADKVLALGYYFENVDSGEVLGTLVTSYLVPAKDDEGKILIDENTGATLYEFSDTADITKLEDAGFDPIDVIGDIIDNTTITSEDVGNVFYYMLLGGAKGEFKNTLEELGEQGFRAMFVDSVTLYGMISGVESGVTLGEIRSVRELMDSLGSEYKAIIERLGYEGLSSLMKGISSSALESELGFGRALADVMDGLSDVSPTILAFFAEALTSVPSDLPTSLEAAINGGNGEAKAYTAIRLAQIAIAGLGGAEAFSETDDDGVIKCFGDVMGAMDYISSHDKDADIDESALQNAKTSYIGKLSDNYQIIKQIAGYGEGIGESYTAGILTEPQVADVNALIADLEIGSSEIERGINKLGTVAMYNLLLGMFSNLYEG